MAQSDTSILLQGACQWIRDNLRSDRTRFDLAVIYVKGQDDLTTLRRAIEEHSGTELPHAEPEEREAIARYLADSVVYIDLTLEGAGVQMVRP